MKCENLKADQHDNLNDNDSITRSPFLPPSLKVPEWYMLNWEDDEQRREATNVSSCILFSAIPSLPSSAEEDHNYIMEAFD